VYGEHRIWAFQDLLGRTMWEFTGEGDDSRFLVIAHSGHELNTSVSARPVPSAALGVELRERLILYGVLAEPESGDTSGIALALQAPDRDAAEALLGDAAEALEAFPDVEVHDWEFGGRR
jgi:hypothetical protein